jgi:hypothetical protein
VDPRSELPTPYSGRQRTRLPENASLRSNTIIGPRTARTRNRRMKHEAHRNADAKGKPRLARGGGKLFFVSNEDETVLRRRTLFSREKNTYARLDGPPLLIEGAMVNSQPVVPPPAAPSRPVNWGSESLCSLSFSCLLVYGAASSVAVLPVVLTAR